MKSLGMIIVLLTTVLILPLSVQAQPPENPPPAGPIQDLQDQIEVLAEGMFDINRLYHKECKDTRRCDCEDGDILITGGAECKLDSTIDEKGHLTMSVPLIAGVSQAWGARCAFFGPTTLPDPENAKEMEILCYQP